MKFIFGYFVWVLLLPLVIGEIRGLLAAEVDPAAAKQAIAKYDADILPLLKKKCFDCHDDKEQAGGVDFSPITAVDKVSQHRKLWKRSAGRVAAGEMPPEDGPKLTAAEKQQLTTWLQTAATFVDLDPAVRDPGPSPLRRLSREEYLQTVADLLYLPRGPLDALGLPDENVGFDFENQAARLSLDPAIMERYFAATERIIDLIYRNEWYSKGARDRLFKPRPNPKLPAREAAEQVITTLLQRAYRRPAVKDDVARLLAFVDQALAKGDSFDEALRPVLKPILMSPQFLFRLERDRPATGKFKGVPVDSHEFAVRLSYFLWGTMPDEELFKVASEGKLTEPNVLAEQLKRILAHDKAKSLTQQFALPWLQIKRLSKARPTQEFFPEFNGQLKQAMHEEVAAFFDHLHKEDRPLLDLLDADYTFANATLAKHYKLNGVMGDKPQKIALQPADHRGGLLGMGAVLALTSHTFRTSPTQRGKYVLEVLLGDPPPPAPANVPPIAEDARKKEATSFKDKLAQHATQPACAGCHKKIDPLGFALENYNAVGAWREGTQEQPLDAQGELPGGITVNGVGDLKKVLLSRKEDFSRGMIEAILKYALGRELDSADDATVLEVQNHLQAGDYRFSALIEGVVRSVPFQQRRPEE